MMKMAMEETKLPVEAEQLLLRFFEDSATFLVNQD